MTAPLQTEKQDLTQRFVNDLLPTGRKMRFPDHKVSGLHLRVAAGGKKTFIIRYRNTAGTLREMRIGDGDKIGVKEARLIAREKLVKASQGTDPLSEKHRLIEEAKRAEASTVAAICDLYFKSANFTTKRPSTQGFYRNALNLYVLPHIGAIPIKAVTRVHISDMLDAVLRERSGSVCNHARSSASVLFSFAVEKGWIDFSPVSAVKVKHRMKVRERILGDEEIRSLWAACLEENGLSKTVAEMVMLCLLLPARAKEVAGMQWEEVDFENALWTIPSERMKGHQRHQLPLAPCAINLLKTRQKDSNYKMVFPDKSGTKTINPKRAGRACNRQSKLMRVDSFGPHDLRRTIATRLAGMGYSRDIIERLLGHKVGGGRAIVNYDHYDYMEPKRKAMEAWEAELSRILSAHTSQQHPFSELL